jgi:uncharacterized membrane protein
MLWTFIGCLGLALLFPLGFKHLVGTFVGALFGGFAWGLFAVTGCVSTFHGAAQSLVMFFIIGAILGNVFAAKG